MAVLNLALHRVADIRVALQVSVEKVRNGSVGNFVGMPRCDEFGSLHHLVFSFFMFIFGFMRFSHAPHTASAKPTASRIARE